MTEQWVRKTLTAEFLSDAHLGSGSGGGGIDALVARDRHDRPVIWASHVEGVLRDAARRLGLDDGAFFGREGGDQQRAIFTSLYSKDKPESRIWRSTAREAFDNRAPKDETLRVVEYVPRGATLVGEVELPTSQFGTLERLVQEVDALGTGRSTGAGHVKLTLSAAATSPTKGGPGAGRLLLLLRNRDPLCITATATPDNVIPSLAFVPGRTLLGAVAAWLIAQGSRDAASLLTSGKVSVSDALPLPAAPANLAEVEVMPAPLSLQSEKPQGAAGDLPWWAQPTASTRRVDAWSQAKDGPKLKRPEDDLFVFRQSASAAWNTFRPARRIRLRNGRPDPKQAEPSLFAVEQIVEDTPFVAQLHGAAEDLKQLAEAIGPVLEGQRWLRVGRAGAPVEVAQIAWCHPGSRPRPEPSALLTLTSDLLVRDQQLRWRTELDESALSELLGVDVRISRSLQDAVMVRGFNGTARLWRMPAAAIRRGSVFAVSGAGVTTLADRAEKDEWLGERTHEGFGRFRIDSTLPGVSTEAATSVVSDPVADVPEEGIAGATRDWFQKRRSLGALDKKDVSGHRPPSLSQWLDLVGELEADDPSAIMSRLNPTTAGGRSWKHQDAGAILDQLGKVEGRLRTSYARFFVRWLRASMRENARGTR